MREHVSIAEPPGTHLRHAIPKESASTAMKLGIFHAFAQREEIIKGVVPRPEDAVAASTAEEAEEADQATRAAVAPRGAMRKALHRGVRPTGNRILSVLMGASPIPDPRMILTERNVTIVRKGTTALGTV